MKQEIGEREDKLRGLDSNLNRVRDHSRTQSPSYARSTDCDEGLWPNPYQTGI